MSRADEGTRTLVLVRHAQAEASGPSDHARELTARGRAAAADVGQWLATQVVPSTALVSDATRTRETWAEIAGAAGWDLEPDLTASLYSDGPESVLDLLRELPHVATSVVVVGHNPTIAYLAGMLDDGEGDDEALSQLVSGGYPPGTVTVFTFDGTWTDLGAGRGTVRAFRRGGG